MDGSANRAWSEEETQDLRPYAVTGGRTAPRHTMRLASLLRARRETPPDVTAEAAQILALCAYEARSVAEIAGTIRQPVLITKVLLSDLIDTGSLVLAVPSAEPISETATLERLLVALRERWPECG
jgi:hypothetical protein